jgi:hypothetical protein
MGIWSIAFISLSLLDDVVNSLDILTSNYTTFIYTFYCMEYGFTKNGFVLLTLGKLRILNLFYTNFASLKPISCNLFSKMLWTSFLICGYVTKSLFNICCPTCLRNPPLTWVSIYGHSMISCPLIVQKTYILNKVWTNLVKYSKS